MVIRQEKSPISRRHLVASSKALLLACCISVERVLQACSRTAFTSALIQPVNGSRHLGTPFKFAKMILEKQYQSCFIKQMTYCSSSYSRSQSHSHPYQYEYRYSYTTQNGQVDNRTVSLPTDCFDRFISYAPRQTISQQNFMKVVQAIMMGSNATDCDIREAFSILDTDRSGTLDVSELAKVIPAIMPGTTSNTLYTMIRRYDKNGDNTLNLNEFIRLVKGDLGRDIVYRDVLMI
ncbi:unnamed protein product [Rotaria socialis]